MGVVLKLSLFHFERHSVSGENTRWFIGLNLMFALIDISVIPFFFFCLFLFSINMDLLKKLKESRFLICFTFECKTFLHFLDYLVNVTKIFDVI